MKIIVPMSGEGTRFRKAGYEAIKPLIEVDGKPMIEHVVAMFPGDTDFIFICSSEHLAETPLEATLKKIMPTGRVVPIRPHKLGPVHAVKQAFSLIEAGEPVVVSYCDFSAYWDYEDFKLTVARNGCDGCVTAYRGFHPHLLGGNLYAGMRDDGCNKMLEIREKHSFTNDMSESFHSAGSYYFRRGAYVEKYFNMLTERDINVNGEYYVSSVYQLMKDDGLDIHIYELEHFLQWGTPEDLEEYVYWSRYFREKYRGCVSS